MVRSRRTSFLLALIALAVFVSTPAQGRRVTPAACGTKTYSYAGVESGNRAHGVATTLSPLETPTVVDGHVGGWVGVGGTAAGPGGASEWLQIGLSAMAKDTASRVYYEVTIPGDTPRYVELEARVEAGERHHFAVLEMSRRKSWWRAWLDHRPVSPPIHLPGSHGTWRPQVVAESWNGNTGACNRFAYRFSDIRLAHRSGGVWRPLRSRSLYEDAGYRVVQTSRVPSTFLATSR